MYTYSTAQALVHFLCLLLYLGAGGWSLYHLWRRKRKYQSSITVLVLVALVLNLILLVWILVDRGTHAVPGKFETITGLTVGIVFMSLLLQNYAKTPFTIPAGTLVGALMLGLATLFLMRPTAPSSTLSFDTWLILHVSVIVLSYVVFTMGFICGLLFLLQDWMVRSKQTGFLFRSLPSLERSESLSKTSILIGFPLLSLGILLGILGGEHLLDQQLSIPWYKDPKVLFSLITWGVYGGLLVLREVLMVKGRKFAYLSILGFCMVLFTLFMDVIWQGIH